MQRFILLVTFPILFTSGNAADAQEQPLPETKVVLRVSGEFLHQLTGVAFKRNEPIRTSVQRAVVDGNAQVDARFEVSLCECETESDFELNVRGTVSTRTVATSRPVVVYMHSVAPFEARRRIGYNGEKFAGQPMQISVVNQLSVDAIRSVRPGPLGALARRFARPAVMRGLPESNRQATDNIRAQIARTVDEETAKLMKALNDVEPIVKKGQDVLIEEGLIPKSDLAGYRAATKDHLCFSVGPKKAQLPKLPAIERSKSAPLELWMVRTQDSREARLDFFLKNWRLIRPVVHDQIVRAHPELARKLGSKLNEILDTVRVETVGDWHVVTFAPELRDVTL
jgi:hypothetical protein